MRSGELEQNERDEADERERFGEGDTQEHRGANHAGSLGLTSHGLDGLADEVARSMDRILAITGQARQGAQMTATSVQELAAQADELRGAIARFRIA